MKILQLDIEGFRSLKKVSWKPSDLNVLIGPNGAGKSNLLRFLELMSVSAQGRLGKYIQSSGGMEPIVWDGQANTISFKSKTTWQTSEEQQVPLTYIVELERLGRSSAYRVQREIFADYQQVEIGKQKEPYKLLERIGLSGYILDNERNERLADASSLIEQETLLSAVIGPFSGNLLLMLFNRELTSWKVYHDVNVNKDSVIRQPVVTRSETWVDADGQNLTQVLHTHYTGDRDFERNIDAAMRAAFGEDFDKLVFPPAADQRIQLRVRWKSLKREQSAADFSDGTLRFLMLLAILANPRPSPLIAIDEPETGLHPSMLPIIAEHAVDAARHTSVIFTTHSPQFLDAFTDTKPTTTVTKWENGETTLNTIGGDKLDYWLKEYTLGGLFKTGELESME